MRKSALLLSFILLASFAFAQTTVAPIILGRITLLDGSGKPLAGGCLYTYAAGTTTPLATYADALGVIQNANPVLLDSTGSAVIFVSGVSYKFQAKSFGGVNCASGAQQWVLDNQQSFNGTINTNTNVTGTFTTSCANPAQTGFIRACSGDAIKFRNTANTLDLSGLSKDSSDRIVLGDTTGAKFPAFVDQVGVTPAPAVSAAQQVRTYTDSVANRELKSENAGAFGYTLKGLIPGCYPNTVAVPITGDLLEHTLFSCSLPANTLLAGGGPSSCMSVVAMFQKSANANNATFKLYLNGSGTAFESIVFSDNVADRSTVLICNNAAVQNAQTIMEDNLVNAVYAIAIGTDTSNTATALTMKATITLSNAGDTVTGKYWFPIAY